MLGLQELNSLFTTLAYNSGNELSLDAITQSSGVSKTTIKRYLEYLEAAFLIKLVSRLGDSGKHFIRQNFFKIYLTNPSIRSALFSPVMGEDPVMGAMTETAIFGQWFHLPTMNIHYARWNQAGSKGEVDIVFRDQRDKPYKVTEIKWTDRFAKGEEKPNSLIYFCQKNGIRTAIITTKTKFLLTTIDGVEVKFVPSAFYCYLVGKSVLAGKSSLNLNEFLSEKNK